MNTGGILCIVGGDVEAWAHLPGALQHALHGSSCRDLRVGCVSDTELTLREVREITEEASLTLRAGLEEPLLVGEHPHTMAIGWLPEVSFPEGLLGTADDEVRLRAFSGVGLGDALRLQLQGVKAKLKAVPGGGEGKRQRRRLHDAEKDLEAFVASEVSLEAM
jgi:hypothetical protein